MSKDRLTAAPSAVDIAGRLIELAGRIQRRVRPNYHVTGLSAARLSALAFVDSQDTCSGGQIAQAEQVTPATMTRILDGLEESGFITRSASKRDRRVVEVRATNEGRAALEKARARQVNQLAGELGRLRAADRARVAEALAILDRPSHQGGS